MRSIGARLLAAEAVEGASLALERVDHIEGSHSLSASMLGVGHGIADDVLEEHLEHTAGLLVDEAADALHTTTASQTADRWLLHIKQSNEQFAHSSSMWSVVELRSVLQEQTPVPNLQ
jgi:hypothetical protein